MSRIYQSGSSNNSYKANTSQSRGYKPNKVSGKSSAIQAEGKRQQRDLKTQEREITRQDAVDSMERQAADTVANLQLKEIQMQQKQALEKTQLVDKFALENKRQIQAADLKAKQQVESFSLANEITVENSVLTLNQLRARNSLKNEQDLENQALGRKSRAEQADRDLDAQYLQSKQAVDNANRQVMVTAINGLVSLAGQYVTSKVQVDEATKIRDNANKWFDNGGATVLNNDNTVNSVVTNDDLQTESLRATETAVQKVGQDNNMTAVQTDSIREPMQRERMTQSLNQIGVHDAAIAIPGLLKEGWASGVKIQLADGTILDPRAITRGEQVHAWAKAYVGDYVTKAGLVNMDPGAVAKSLYPSAINSVSAFASKEAGNVLTTQINNRKAVATEKMVKAIKTGNISLQEIFSTYSAELNGSGDYNLDPSRSSKDAAVNMLSYMSPEQIRTFEKVTKIRGNSGLTIGDLYEPEFEKALKEERAFIRSSRLWHSENDRQTVKQLKIDHNRALLDADTPEEITAAHEAYKSALLPLAGTSDEAMTAYQNQIQRGSNYNPFAAEQLIADAQSNGETYTPEYIDDLVNSGVINEAGKKVILQSGLVEIEAPGLTRAKDSVGKMKAEILGVAEGMTDAYLPKRLKNFPNTEKFAKKAVALINNDLADRARKALVQEVVENPGIMKERGVRRQFVQKWMNDNGQKLLENIKYNDETMLLEGYTFAGSQDENIIRKYQNKFTGGISRALQNVNTSTLRALTKMDSKGKPISDLSPVNDRLLGQEDLQELMEAIVAGKPDQISQRTKIIADLTGLTPKALAIYQGMGTGVDTASMLEPAPPSPGQGGPNGPTNVKEGAKALYTQFGLPKRAAAYLAANIQQESTWYGQRQPWDDVGAQAGGLVSWRAERLVRIEDYLGKPITQASNRDQIKALLWEMETYYEAQYRIFTNPLSNDAALRGASEDFWGWGVEGFDRFGTFLDEAKSALNIY